jgi:hypothetical protein
MQVAVGALSKACDDDEDARTLDVTRSLAGEDGATASAVTGENGAAGSVGGAAESDEKSGHGNSVVARESKNA